LASTRLAFLAFFLTAFLAFLATFFFVATIHYARSDHFLPFLSREP
jgi:hypothetical protein